MIGGMMVQEAVVDEKGRVVIPKRFREGLGLRRGSRVRLILDKKRIVITKAVAPEEFVREMEGCVKEGSPIPRVDPLGLKGIWEQP